MKDYIKIIAFTGIILITLASLSAIFNGRFWYTTGYVADRDARYAAFDLEEPGQIDVLNIGSSLCDVSITPLELYRDYGITCYNMGRDMQTRAEAYYAVKTALRKNKIKVLLWETDNLCRLLDKDQDEYTPYREELAEFYRYHFPILRYHSFWKYWLNGTKHSEYFKGYLVRKEIEKPLLEDILDEEDTEEGQNQDNGSSHESQNGNENDISFIHAKRLRAKVALKDQLKFKRYQMHAFKEIYNLCRANGIKLVLYSTPSLRFYPTRRRHDAVAELARKYGIDYLDGNFDEYKIGIDWNRDSFDEGGHLNLYGTRKMTKYLAEYLINSCNLPDHRGDPAYSNWTDMERYEEVCGE